MFRYSVLGDRSLELQEVIPSQSRMGTNAEKSTQTNGSTGIAVLDDVLPEGFPSPCAVLILADPGAGKEFLTTEMLSVHLGKGHQVLWLSLENFTETLRNMIDSVSIATQNNPWNSRLAFVDCYSSQIGMRSRERYSADPGNLPNLSIVTSVAISEASKEGRLLVVLDSLSSLIQKVGVRGAIEFFRMLVAKTRSINADLLATLNRKAFNAETLALFQEIADCVIELTVRENDADIDHYLRVRKMLRLKHSSNWIPYQIDSEHCLLERMPGHGEMPTANIDRRSTGQNGLRSEILLPDDPAVVDSNQIRDAGDQRRLDQMFDPYGKASTLQETERLAAIGQIVAMIGHDLRNPLQVMINKIYLARKQAEESPNALSDKFLRDLEEQIEHMNKIVASLRDYSKFEPALVSTDPKQLIEEALATLTVPETVKLSVEAPRDIPKIMADRHMMKRALANIIVNAVQAMPEGGRLMLRAAAVAGVLSITIQDTGIGIARENLGKIFTPLYTTKADSTGIGLTISKRFVESHNGTIEVESEIGKGSTFTIKLPLR